MPRAPLPALVALPALLFCACAPDPAPAATVLDASPAALDTTRDDADDLHLTVGYRDADGDLGGGEARVQDCRAADLVTRLAIPPIASAEAVAAGAPISGQLKLLVPDVAALAPEAPPSACAGADPVPAHSAVFCVVLRDAAGHEGAAACTGPIGITGG